MGILGDLKNVIDEKALVDRAAEVLIPALRDALKPVLEAAISQLLAGLDGLTITVSRKPEA